MSSSSPNSTITSDDQPPENNDFSVVVAPNPSFHYFTPRNSTLPPIYFASNSNLPPPPPTLWVCHPVWFFYPNPKWFKFTQELPLLHSPNPSQELTHPPLLHSPNPRDDLSYPPTRSVFGWRSYGQAGKKLNFRRKIKHRVESNDDLITTVMLRNVPNRYTREMMIEFMDKFCEEANKNEKDEESLISAYDFLYIPIDFKTEMNKGFAFVNFTNAKGVFKFKAACNYKTWPRFGSRKVLEIATARIQGKDKLVSHFQQMIYPIEVYSAICFSPARTGLKNTVQPTMVGRCTEPMDSA